MRASNFKWEKVRKPSVDIESKVATTIEFDCKYNALTALKYANM